MVRFEPKLDWSGCHYEFEELSVIMERTQDGNWVSYGMHKEALKILQNKIETLQAKLDALMLEFVPDEMTPDQLRKYSEHQKPV